MSAAEGRREPANTRSLWPATREQFEREADIAEAKYGPLVMNLRPPEVVGLERAVTKKLAALNAELKAEATKTMQERGTSIGSKAFRDMRRGR